MKNLNANKSCDDHHENIFDSHQFKSIFIAIASRNACCKTFFFLRLLTPQQNKEHCWSNDIQHNDTEHNDIQHNDTQHNDTQHNDIQHKNN